MKLAGVVGAVAVMAGVCRGGHSDIGLGVVAGRLVTEREGVEWRVFGSEFEPALGFTDEPGFVAGSSSGLPSNVLLGFKILDGVRRWDSASGTFGPAGSGAVTVQFGGASAMSPGGCNETAAGFVFAQASGNGSVHQHVQFVLGAPATPGVYLLKLEVFAEHPGVQTSEPFWIVFSNDAEAEHEAAEAFVEESIAEGCAGDVNGDGMVSGADLSVLLSSFGGCVMNGTSADLNGDGTISGADLSVLLARFGTGC